MASKTRPDEGAYLAPATRHTRYYAVDYPKGFMPMKPGLLRLRLRYARKAGQAAVMVW